MASDTLSPGLTLAGRYRLFRPLGAGAMGAVWEAVDEAVGRVVAVKLMAEQAPSAELLRRFELEASAARVINHPSIVEVLDSGTTPWGAPFLVMERLVGLPLSAFARHVGQLTPAVAAAVLAPLLEGLAAAHAAGVVHRDVKPDNVFLTHTPREGVKLLDWGISHFDDARLTQTGMTFGTPAYMPPEQVRDARQAGPRADVYSAGAVLFELLTGRAPFEGDNALSLAARVLTEAAPPVASVRNDVPPLLATAVDRALARAPEARFPDALAFHAALVAAAPPDRAGLFAEVRRLAPSPAEPPGLPAPRPQAGVRAAVRASAREVTLASVLERLSREGRRLPLPVAARLAADLLRRSDAPASTSPATIYLDDAGAVRAGAPPQPVVTLGAAWRTWAAPEVVLGLSPTAAATQFSVGVVLLEALTGDAFLSAPSRDALVALLRGPPPVPPLGAGAPRELVTVLQRMLQADAGRRFATNAGCAEALTACFAAAPAAWERALAARAALVRERAPARAVALPPEAPRTRWGLLLGVLVAGLVAVGVLATRGPLVIVEGDVAPPPPQQPGLPMREVKDEPALQELLGEAALAHIELRTRPEGAAIWQAGQLVGFAPGTLSVPAGRTTHLQLTLPCHAPTQVDLSPTAPGVGAPVEARLTPTCARAGTAAVRSRPDDALVLLDGERVGRTPTELLVEADRPHVLEVQFPDGRASRQDVTLSAGQRRTFEAVNE